MMTNLSLLLEVPLLDILVMPLQQGLALGLQLGHLGVQGSPIQGWSTYLSTGLVPQLVRNANIHLGRVRCTTRQ